MATLQAQLEAAMEGLGAADAGEDEVEHDYELTNSQLTEMEEDIEETGESGDSNIASEMHGASQVAIEDDLHGEADEMPEPENIAQYRDSSISEIAKQARIANTKLQKDMAAFVEYNPNMCMEELRKQVFDMDETTEDEKAAKIKAVEDFNAALSIRRMCRNNGQLRNWIVQLSTAFANVPDATEFEKQKQILVDSKAAIEFKKAELLKRKKEEIEAEVNAELNGTAKKAKTTAGAGSSSDGFRRPPGRAPTGKEWDSKKGEWVKIKTRR